MKLHFTTLLDLLTALPDEQAAIDHFRAVRWKNGAFCPYCGSVKVYHFANKRTHKCGDCRQRFSIKVGTIFEDSNIGLRTWMLAIWFITSHKKGIASTQLAKDLGVTQKTAWFIMHRLRHTARSPSYNRQLGGGGGIVEADEAFIGGKDANKPRAKRGLRKKAIVFGMLEREGERQIYGIHHWVSHKHLGRYVDESVWRYNRREMTEADRFNALIAAASGRLTYRELTADRSQ